VGPFLYLVSIHHRFQFVCCLNTHARLMNQSMLVDNVTPLDYLDIVEVVTKPVDYTWRFSKLVL
jgi:hypothetical protein